MWFYESKSEEKKRKKNVLLIGLVTTNESMTISWSELKIEEIWKAWDGKRIIVKVWWTKLTFLTGN